MPEPIAAPAAQKSGVSSKGVSQPQLNETPVRIEALAKLPIFWALEGKLCVVSGGSDAAAWKAELLAACGAHVKVFTREPDEMMRALASRPAAHIRADISLIGRSWRQSDLQGAAMAVAACDDSYEAERFYTACGAMGVPVNVIDKPLYCQFQFGSIVNRSPVIVAISTDGAAPVLARTIRSKIEVLLPASLQNWAELAQAIRSRIGSLLPTAAARRRFWEIFVEKAFSEKRTARTEGELLTTASELVLDAGDVKVFSVNPIDPELMTLKAIRGLQTADVVFFDKGIAPEILQFGRREAIRIQVEDRPQQGSWPQNCRVVYLVSDGDGSTKTNISH